MQNFSHLNAEWLWNGRDVMQAAAYQYGLARLCASSPTAPAQPHHDAVLVPCIEKRFRSAEGELFIGFCRRVLLHCRRVAKARALGALGIVAAALLFWAVVG